jgi:hypothetical protein
MHARTCNTHAHTHTHTHTHTRTNDRETDPERQGQRQKAARPPQPASSLCIPGLAPRAACCSCSNADGRFGGGACCGVLSLRCLCCFARYAYLDAGDDAAGHVRRCLGSRRASRYPVLLPTLARQPATHGAVPHTPTLHSNFSPSRRIRSARALPKPAPPSCLKLEPPRAVVPRAIPRPGKTTVRPESVPSQYRGRPHPAPRASPANHARVEEGGLGGGFRVQKRR